MYPYELIPSTGIDLYVVLILAGIIAAFFSLRFFSRKVSLPAKIYNFVLAISVAAIVLGWLSAMLFQALFDYRASGSTEFGGQTFLGGLIGGAGAFLAIYFGIGGLIFKDGSYKRDFPKLLVIAIPSIVIAHAFGRLGCLAAGCCYGRVTDSFIGIKMYSGGVLAKRVPTQLFEAVFLFALFAVFAYIIIGTKFRNTLSVYLIGYGVWRFFIEFLRDDPERGVSLVKGLYPSQVISLIMIAAGVVFAVFYEKRLKSKFL